MPPRPALRVQRQQVGEGGPERGIRVAVAGIEIQQRQSLDLGLGLGGVQSGRSGVDRVLSQKCSGSPVTAIAKRSIACTISCAAR